MIRSLAGGEKPEPASSAARWIFRRCLEVQRPYLGPVVGVYTDWTPVTGRGALFPEDMDPSDAWQFKNVLVR